MPRSHAPSSSLRCDPSDPAKYLACVKACDQNCPHMAGEDPIRTYIA